MLSARRLALGLATLIALPGRAPAQERRGPRAEIETLEVVLDRAVGRVSHPSSRVLFGAAEAHGYPLKGYGVIFVLPPRALPLPRHAAGPSPRRGARDRELKAIEEQVEAFQREAEAARQEAERAFEEMVRQMRGQAAAPNAAAALAPESAPALVVPPAPAAEPPPPAPAPTPAVAGVPAPPAPPRGLLPPPPPWAFWFETETGEDERSSEQVIGDVRTAIQGALEGAGPQLGMLGPDEFVVVGVDFVSPGALVEQARPDHTLVVRVRKKDLDARRAGRIDSRELGRRIEFAEY